MNFTDNDIRTVLVTGALKGIGLAIAKKMYTTGCNVCLIERQTRRAMAFTKLQILSTNLNLQNRITEFCLPNGFNRCEIIENTVNSIHNDFKAIDVVINNASVIKLSNTSKSQQTCLI